MKIAPKAVKGVLDLSSWDFDKDGPIDLSGEYEFFWNQLIFPEDFLSGNTPEKFGFIAVPGFWHKFKSGKIRPEAEGYATYRLRIVIDPKIKTESLAIKYEEYLADVHSSSKHLLSLINDILDLSKVEAGKLEYKPTKVDLNKLLTNSLIMIQEKAVKNGIKISSDLDGIPDPNSADERMLKQILYNLSSNAVKFTPDGGGIDLEAKRVLSVDLPPQKNRNPSREYIQISIIDSGIGLKKEDLEMIFQPFEQVENSASRRFQGTGLGLSLSKRFVELHGGKIWAESEGDGLGATFRFTLPL